MTATPATRRTALRALLLAVALLAGLLVAPGAATSQTGASNIDMDQVQQHSDPARRLFNLINAEREAEGRSALRWNTTLEVVAADWSVTMDGDDRLYHRPDLGQVITSSWRRLGENVGVGPRIDRLHQAFMDSPGHRANVVGDFDQVGIAVVQGETRLWVTVNFGKGDVSSTTVRAPSTRTTVTSTGGTTSADGPFGDVPATDAHAPGIEALADAGITTGCTTRSFCPRRSVTRGQMAAFVARAMGLSTSGGSSYRDVADGSWYDGPIAAMERSGVMEPAYGSDWFSPDRAVTRAEMAGILARMEGLPMTATSTRFTDVTGAELIAEVEAIRSAGITTGVTATRYAPSASVTRAEMATFIARALDLI